MKAQTDTTQPNSLKFPLLKNKKRQLEEGIYQNVKLILLDKITEIERENRMLLEKMTIIMNTDTNEYNANNNINVTPPFVNSPSPLRQRGVNHTISLILDRLRQQKSHYDPEKWKQHEVKHDKILRIRKEVVTSGGELITQPPVDLQTEEDQDYQDDGDQLMEELLKDVDDLDGNGIDPRGFNSDLRAEKVKTKMTPPDNTMKTKLHQTVSHFNSRHQSGGDGIIVQEQHQQFNETLSSKIPMTITKGEEFISNDRQESTIYAQQQHPQYQTKTLEQQQQVESIRPLHFKYYDSIDPQRIVLYREDFREIVKVEATSNKRRFLHPKYYIVEVSRSRYRLYIISVKIPNKYLDYVMSGRGIYQLAAHPRSKIFYLDITEKQGKKLLQECNNDFTLVMERLYIQFGKLHIRDLENILKFGSPTNQLPYFQNAHQHQHHNHKQPPQGYTSQRQNQPLPKLNGSETTPPPQYIQDQTYSVVDSHPKHTHTQYNNNQQEHQQYYSQQPLRKSQLQQQQYYTNRNNQMALDHSSNNFNVAMVNNKNKGQNRYRKNKRLITIGNSGSNNTRKSVDQSFQQQHYQQQPYSVTNKSMVHDSINESGDYLSQQQYQKFQVKKNLQQPQYHQHQFPNINKQTTQNYSSQRNEGQGLNNSAIVGGKLGNWEYIKSPVSKVNNTINKQYESLDKQQSSRNDNIPNTQEITSFVETFVEKGSVRLTQE